MDQLIINIEKLNLSKLIPMTYEDSIKEFREIFGEKNVSQPYFKTVEEQNKVWEILGDVIFKMLIERILKQNTIIKDVDETFKKMETLKEYTFSIIDENDTHGFLIQPKEEIIELLKIVYSENFLEKFLNKIRKYFNYLNIILFDDTFYNIKIIFTPKTSIDLYKNYIKNPSIFYDFLEK